MNDCAVQWTWGAGAERARRAQERPGAGIRRPASLAPYLRVTLEGIRLPACNTRKERHREGGGLNSACIVLSGWYLLIDYAGCEHLGRCENAVLDWKIGAPSAHAENPDDTRTLRPEPSENSPRGSLLDGGHLQDRDGLRRAVARGGPGSILPFRAPVVFGRVSQTIECRRRQRR